MMLLFTTLTMYILASVLVAGRYILYLHVYILPLSLFGNNDTHNPQEPNVNIALLNSLIAY